MPFGLFERKPERPYLRLCKVCGGKGQLSYLDQYQRKTYGPCQHCSNGCGPYALGVSVKCACQGPAVPYSWALGTELHHIKKYMEPRDLAALKQLQKALGAGGVAVLLLCEPCGARYLAQDGVGARRRISTEKEMGEADKEFNRHIAATLVANGIVRDLDRPDWVPPPSLLSPRAVAHPAQSATVTPTQEATNPLAVRVAPKPGADEASGGEWGRRAGGGREDDNVPLLRPRRPFADTLAATGPLGSPARPPVAQSPVPRVDVFTTSVFASAIGNTAAALALASPSRVRPSPHPPSAPLPLGIPLGLAPIQVHPPDSPVGGLRTASTAGALPAGSPCRPMPSPSFRRIRSSSAARPRAGPSAHIAMVDNAVSALPTDGAAAHSDDEVDGATLMLRPTASMTELPPALYGSFTGSMASMPSSPAAASHAAWPRHGGPLQQQSPGAAPRLPSTGSQRRRSALTTGPPALTAVPEDALGSGPTLDGQGPGGDAAQAGHTGLSAQQLPGPDGVAAPQEHGGVGEPPAAPTSSQAGPRPPATPKPVL